MDEVSDAFLLQMAEVAAGLFGLFMVGMLFYVETGFRRLGPEREVVVPYFRASTRIVLVLFAIPLFLSLTLVVLEPVWSTVLFAVLSLALIATNLDTAAQVRSVRAETGSLVLWLNEIAGRSQWSSSSCFRGSWAGSTRAGRTSPWSILIAFLSLATTILSILDIAGSHRQPTP